MKENTMSYFHEGGDVPLLGSTIPAHFQKIVARYPDQPAVISIAQGARLSYSELNQQVITLAKGLYALGYRPGDRIGIWSTNNIEWLVVQLATAKIGVVLVNINPANKGPELEYALKRSEVQGLFTIPAFKSSNYEAMLAQLLPSLKQPRSSSLGDKVLPELRHCVIYNPEDPLQSQSQYPGFMLWQEVLAEAGQVSDETLRAVTNQLDIDDPINIQYTSGTTGFPKPVVLSHHNLINNAYFCAQLMHFTEEDRLCVPVPFYHCFGMVLANLLCLSVGACLVLPSEYFDPLATMQAIEEESCTALHGVPTMFIAQLEHPEFERFNFQSLRTGIMAGAPCPPELMKRVIDVMHCPDILIGYGETEASPLTHLTRKEDDFVTRIETVGKNLPHQEVKVIDTEFSTMVPLGEIGEICFRGYHVMNRYYKDPDATAKAFDEHGWLRSGDLGTMDKSGYVRITGRLKEMIIRGGENIYPAEIEEVLFNHPQTEQVAVFGIPDPYFGEEIMAWIRVRQGEELSEEALRTYCKETLAHFKIPKYLWFVETFPMTVTGKVQKFRMRELALEELSKA